MIFKVFSVVLLCVASACFAQSDDSCPGSVLLGRYEHAGARIDELYLHESGELLFGRELNSAFVLDIRGPGDPVLIDAVQETFPGGYRDLIVMSDGFYVISNHKMYWIALLEDHTFASSSLVYELKGLFRDDSSRFGTVAAFLTNDGVELVDCAIPETPVHLDTYLVNTSAWRFAGNGLGVSHEGDHLVVHDLRDPINSKPALLDEVGPGEEFLDATYSSDILYVLMSNRIIGYDVNDDFLLVYNVQLPVESRAESICVDEDRLIVNIGIFGYLVYSVNVHDEPKLTGSRGSEGRVRQVLLNNDELIIRFASRSFRIYSVENPDMTIYQVLSTSGGQVVRDMVRHNELVAVTVPFQDLQLYGEDESGNLAYLSQLSIPGNVWALASDGEYLYVASDQLGVFCVDIQDPYLPVLRGVWESTSDINSVDAHDGYVAVGTSRDGVFFVDFTDPDSPELRVHRPHPMNSEQVLFEWPYVFSRNSGTKLRVYDWTDPNRVPQVDEVSFGNHSARDIASGAGFLYIAVNHNLMMYNLATYTGNNLEHLQTRDFGQFIYSVNAEDNRLAVQSGSGNSFAVPVYDFFEIGLAADIDFQGSYQSEAQFGSGFVYGNRVHTHIWSLLVSIRFDGCLCPADLNADGALNFFDISAFLVAYLGGDALGDWNGDGVWDFFDVSGFLTDYQAGCP